MKKYFLILFLSCWFGSSYSQTTANLVRSYTFSKADTTFVKQVASNFGWSMQVNVTNPSDTCLFEVMASSDGVYYTLYSTPMSVYNFQMEPHIVGDDTIYSKIFENSHFVENYIGLRIVRSTGQTGTVNAILTLKQK